MEQALHDKIFACKQYKDMLTLCKEHEVEKHSVDEFAVIFDLYDKTDTIAEGIEAAIKGSKLDDAKTLHYIVASIIGAKATSSTIEGMLIANLLPKDIILKNYLEAFIKALG